mmetsp:Transcript_113968/g.233195  ORF Transcript_113968/g.233195 Transcript_113968/m.233195 type:complete len:106 (-) Transcript_113968:133-450(-)
MDDEEVAPNSTQQTIAGMDAGSKKDFLMGRGTANIFDLVSAMREDRAMAPRRGNLIPSSWESFPKEVATQYRAKAQYQYGERLRTPTMILKEAFPDNNIPAPYKA